MIAFWAGLAAGVCLAMFVAGVAALALDVKRRRRRERELAARAQLHVNLAQRGILTPAAIERIGKAMQNVARQLGGQL